MTGRLGRLLRPGSIAFVGGEAAGRAADQCIALGFEGDMWMVNPRRAPRPDLPTAASAAGLPAAVDAAFVGVNRSAAVEVVRDLAAGGAGGAVCHASGFAEIGAGGAALQRELVAAAAGMPVVGPNCYGIVSAVAGAALWPDQQGLSRCERGAALVTQSGNIALNLTMQQRGLDVAYVAALGNQADVGVEEMLEALAADEAVTAVGICIEALSDPARFAEAVGRARARGVPVAALKSGVTAAGGAIAASHTSSLVGDDDAYGALFRRLGVRRVESIPELLDTLAVVTAVGSLEGNRLVSLSCSGGEAALVADRARGRDLVFPPFGADHRDRVAATLNEMVAVTNPLDYHTFIWGDRPRLEACFTAVLDGGFDAAVLVLDFPRAGLDRSRWWPTLSAFGAAAAATGVPGVVAASMAENLPAEVQTAAAEASLAAVGDIDAALSGLEAAAELGRVCRQGVRPARLLPPTPVATGSEPGRQPKPAPAATAGKAEASQPPAPAAAATTNETAEASQPPAPAAAATTNEAAETSQSPGLAAPAGLADSKQRRLDEPEAKALLASVGIAVPQGEVVDADSAAGAAARIGFPVVVKAVGLDHKSDVGGVAVNLKDANAVARAAARLAALSLERKVLVESQVEGGAMSGPSISGTRGGKVLVESQVEGGLAELLVSVRSSHPIGWLLTLGAGGELVEVLDDTVCLLLPESPEAVRSGLEQLRVWPLLAGFRGRPAAAVDAVIAVTDRLADLVRDRPELIEIEVNPLVVTADAAVAVDALAVVNGAGGIGTLPARAEPVAVDALTSAGGAAAVDAQAVVDGAGDALAGGAGEAPKQTGADP